MDKKFSEIEHKYLVDEYFNFEKFAADVLKLGPHDHYEVDVLDHYFIINSSPKYIYRHRVDKKMQVLTAKSNMFLQAKDNEVREEINILLSQQLGQQTSQVMAFLQTLGARWSGCIAKKVHVFNFRKCEVCFYSAHKTADDNAPITKFYCIEFEAKDFDSVEDARRTLANFEKRLGFFETTREKSSIFELVFSDEIQSINLFGTTTPQKKQIKLQSTI